MVVFLLKLLNQNIIFIAKELGIKLNNKVHSELKLDSLFPKIVNDGQVGAFKGEFQTNFLLPNFLGIGIGITKGYGVMFSQYNPSDFNFDSKIITPSTPHARNPHVQLDIITGTTALYVTHHHPVHAGVIEVCIVDPVVGRVRPGNVLPVALPLVGLPSRRRRAQHHIRSRRGKLVRGLGRDHRQRAHCLGNQKVIKIHIVRVKHVDLG